MNSFAYVLRLVIIVFLIVPLTIKGEEKYEYRIIKDPKHTMEETHYTELVKVGEIADEVAENKFLFYPLDLTADSTGALYIYDRYQSTVIKLDKNLKYVSSIGRYGFGPGEFTAKGMGPLVYVNVCMDNRLYVNDTRGFRVSAFELDGTFVRQIKYNRTKYLKPVAGKGGSLIAHEWKNKKLRFLNERDETLFEFPYGGKDSKIDYLYHKKIDHPDKKIIRKRRNRWFPLSFFEISVLTISDSSFLFYLNPSATAYLIEEGKLIRRLKIWPKKALLNLKKRISDKLKMNKYYTAKMFYRILPDGDQNGILYFHHGNVKEDGRNYLYKINLRGELMAVLYVKLEKDAPFVNFGIKKNGLFYARYDEKVNIYREVAK